jgi:hypothetical protein
VGGYGAHGDEVGQKEAGVHRGEVGQKEAEDHDDHAQKAESAVLDAHDAHLVRNDVHEVHNDGLDRTCQTCIQDGMRRSPRHFCSESHCGGAASDPGKRDLGLKGKWNHSGELRVVIDEAVSRCVFFLT